MSTKTNEEIKKLEEQLELLKKKEQLEDENKQLKEDVAYLRKSQEIKDKASALTGMGAIGCFGIQGIGCLIIIIIFIFGAIFSI